MKKKILIGPKSGENYRAAISQAQVFEAKVLLQHDTLYYKAAALRTRNKIMAEQDPAKRLELQKQLAIFEGSGAPLAADSAARALHIEYNPVRAALVALCDEAILSALEILKQVIADEKSLFQKWDCAYEPTSLSAAVLKVLAELKRLREGELAGLPAHSHLPQAGNNTIIRFFEE